MSMVGDAFNALRQVILIQSRLDQLDSRMSRMATDLAGMTEALAVVRDRISRLEGVIEGAVMATRQRRIED